MVMFSLKLQFVSENCGCVAAGVQTAGALTVLQRQTDSSYREGSGECAYL